MPRRRLCIHRSCPASPHPGCRLCDEHAGRLALSPAQWAPPAVAAQAPTLGSEIARLAAQRDRVEHWLEQMMAEGTGQAAEVRRTLLALSQLGRSLTAMLQKNDAGGASELDSLFAEAARKVRESAKGVA
ncbi:MAG TPA: hypothetical protein PLJ35_17820 [Anaerolineae bacterium]|nr:hypothetical protein [Anaerolineae bacterium]